jgi:hypothetical protein
VTVSFGYDARTITHLPAGESDDLFTLAQTADDLYVIAVALADDDGSFSCAVVFCDEYMPFITDPENTTTR